MKDISTGADIFVSVIKWTTETNLYSSKLIGVTTDGAPAMGLLHCSKNTSLLITN